MANEEVQNVTIERLGVFATEEEQNAIRAVMAEGVNVTQLINALAEVHGLPKTQNGYGILMPPGEFVGLAA